MIYQTDGVFICSFSISKIFQNRTPPKKIILIDSFDDRFDSVYVDNEKKLEKPQLNIYLKIHLRKQTII